MAYGFMVRVRPDTNEDITLLLDCCNFLNADTHII